MTAPRAEPGVSAYPLPGFHIFRLQTILYGMEVRKVDNLTSRLTEKGQTTVTKPLREALNLAAGDSIAYRMSSNAVILSKVTAGDLDWNHSVETTLTEWNDDLDDEL